MSTHVGSAGGSHDPTTVIPGRRSEIASMCTAGAGETSVDKVKAAPKANIGVVAPGPGHTTGPKHLVTTRVGLPSARPATTLPTLVTPGLEASIPGNDVTM